MIHWYVTVSVWLASAGYTTKAIQCYGCGGDFPHNMVRIPTRMNKKFIVWWRSPVWWSAGQHLLPRTAASP